MGAASLCAASLLLLTPVPAAWAQPQRCDPSKVVSYAACAKCHSAAIATWQQTPHFQTFEQLHRNPRAKQICQNMGLGGSIKRNDVCIDCHYTVQKQDDGRLRAISGVSCESCHNAASDWINVHSDYGGPTATQADETPEHRAFRLAEAVKQGMRNPRNVYSLARSCLNCHTVPNERLVNTGGHQARSGDFELVSWSQGSVRHNFVRSNGASNARNDQPTLRVMYVAGLIADLEFSTRAVSQATEKSTYGLTVAQRAAAVASRLYGIQQQIQNAELQKILVAFSAARLAINNQDELQRIADEIEILGFQFAEHADGKTMEFVDSLIPPPSAYR